MAPTIPLDYTGHRESKSFSKTAFGDMMGKTRKVSKGYSVFVPDYRHAVETVAESEGFGGSGRIDAELTASQDSCAPSKKCPSFNVDGYEGSVVPIQILSLSKMSALERRDLEVRLRSELDLVQKFQRKIASYSVDTMVHSPTTDVHSCKNGQKRPGAVEGLPRSINDMPMAAGKKKCPPGRNGSRSKVGAVAARRDESMTQCRPQSTGLTAVMKQCEILLTRLMSHQHGWIFNTPVDIVKHNIPDYFNIIKHPMDLGTIKSKLRSNQYTNAVEFAADVRLTFKNAMTYNPPGHDVHVMAEQLSKYFEVRWKPIEKKIPPTADESTPSKPESAYVPAAKKQKTTAESKVKHERDKQTMSDAEKQKLGMELEASLAELPDNIINFLKESTLNCGQVSEDEIEIDIDALSDDTLFNLRKLLDDYLLEKNKKQAVLEPCEIEIKKESGFSDWRDDEAADEDVDIVGNDPPPTSSSPSMMTDKNDARRNCSGSRSSSESGSSSAETESGSSASEPDSAMPSVPASNMNESVNTRVESKESEPGEPNRGDFLNGHAGQNSMSDSSFNCRLEGESAQPERQVSPEKQYRAALLRSRFADIIIKAQENTIEKGAEKLKLEREELERRRREEKARLQAEAKAAEEARKNAEVEAAAEAKRKRELEREAARQALQKMEKTVDINENSHFMEDLEMFRSAPDEHLQSFTDEGSPENSENGFGGFKFQPSSNPLEQLGLYMKNDDDDDEEETEPQSNPETSDNPEEGEID